MFLGKSRIDFFKLRCHMVGRLFLAAVALMVANSEGRAIDLATIPRTIRKEPTYEGQPRYCLLVFGPEAKTRTWMVRDDRYLYLDRAGAGDLTAPECKFTIDYSTITIADVGVPGRRRSLSLYTAPDGFRLRFGSRNDDMQFVGVGLMDRPNWGDKAESAPVIHFGGPMTLARYGPMLTVPRQPTGLRRSTSLRVMVGTPGLGQGTFASYEDICARQFGPLTAEITYPSAADRTKTIKERHELAHDG